MYPRYRYPSTLFMCCIVIFFGHLSLTSSAQKQAKVLIIGLDGCRSDALQIVETPQIDRLAEKGYSCFESRTIEPTMSGPGWASMLTGVWYTEHQVQGNLFIGHQFQKYPHLFTVLKKLRPSTRTASISHWAPINEKIVKEVDYQKSPKSDAQVCKEALYLLKDKNPDVLFVHFDAIDHAGHFYGFHPQVKQYRQAIQEVDIYVGKLLDALKNRKTYAKEDWLILLSTDHGGIKRGHGGGTEVERTTFIIASKSGIEKQQVKSVHDSIFSYSFLQIDSTTAALTIPLDDSLDCSNWHLHFLIKIDQWQKGATWLNTPQFKLMTHPRDGYSWLLKAQNTTFKLQGDSINDGQWHKIEVEYREDRLHVYQNERLIAIKNQTIPLESMHQTINLGADKQALKWTIAQFRWETATKHIPKKTVDLNDFRTKDNSLVKAKTSTDIIVYKNYRHFPLVIDLVPTILRHLSIPQNQWPPYLKGNELYFNK